MLCHVPQQLNRLGLIAWLAWIVRGNHDFDFHGHNESTALDQTRSLQSLSLNSHDMASVKKVNGHKLRHSTHRQVRPNSLYLCAIG